MADTGRSTLDAATDIVLALIDEKSVSLYDTVQIPEVGRIKGTTYQKVIEAFKAIHDVCMDADEMDVGDRFSTESKT